MKTKRPGLRIAARKGTDRPAAGTRKSGSATKRHARARSKTPERGQDVGRASHVLTSPLQQSGLNFTVQAAPFKNTQKEASVALAIEIDGDRLQYSTPDAKGMARTRSNCRSTA